MKVYRPNLKGPLVFFGIIGLFFIIIFYAAGDLLPGLMGCGFLFLMTWSMGFGGIYLYEDRIEIKGRLSWFGYRNFNVHFCNITSLDYRWVRIGNRPLRVFFIKHDKGTDFIQISPFVEHIDKIKLYIEEQIQKKRA